jgi:hypothetical protein
MTAYSKVSYDDQYDGRIFKAARKQQYIMFPAPIVFLNDEIKVELGMNTKKEEEEDGLKFCILKVPIDGTKTPRLTLSIFASMIWVLRSNLSAKLPQTKMRQPTDTQTSQHTLRATQVRCALARAYTEVLQNRPLWHPL